jgi:hypothetical protein
MSLVPACRLAMLYFGTHHHLHVTERAVALLVHVAVPAPQAVMSCTYMLLLITCYLFVILLLTCQHANGLQACLPHRESWIFPPHAPVCICNHHLAHLHVENAHDTHTGSHEMRMRKLLSQLAAQAAPVCIRDHHLVHLHTENAHHTHTGSDEMRTRKWQFELAAQTAPVCIRNHPWLTYNRAITTGSRE